MKATLFVVGVGLLLACTGCTRPTDDTTVTRLAALESKVGQLENRNSDLTLKARIISNQLFDSPLDRFFASPEFWENTYDSGQADCSKRCTATLTTEFAACANNPNPTACRQTALDKASACQTQCSMNFPPPIP